MDKLTKEQVIALVTQQFDTPIIVSLQSTMDTIEEWDSLVHLGILVALDVELEGKVASLKKLAGCRSVQDIIVNLREAGLIAE